MTSDVLSAGRQDYVLAGHHLPDFVAGNPLIKESVERPERERDDEHDDCECVALDEQGKQFPDKKPKESDGEKEKEFVDTRGAKPVADDS